MPGGRPADMKNKLIKREKEQEESRKSERNIRHRVSEEWKSCRENSLENVRKKDISELEEKMARTAGRK